MLRKKGFRRDVKNNLLTDAGSTSLSDLDGKTEVPLGGDTVSFAVPKRTKKDCGGLPKSLFTGSKILRGLTQDSKKTKYGGRNACGRGRWRRLNNGRTGILAAVFFLTILLFYNILPSKKTMTGKGRQKSSNYANIQALRDFLRTSTIMRPTRGDTVALIYLGQLGYPKNYKATPITYPGVLDNHDMDDSDDSRDFGGLQFKLLEEGEHRQIYHALDEMKPFHRPRDSDSEDPDRYYAFDDDYNRNSYHDFDDDELMDTRRCRRTPWYRYQFPTCNVFHELGLDASIPKLVGHGAWRQVFLYDKDTYPVPSTENFILKELKYDRDLTYISVETIRMDALVSERLTSRSNIVDVYGFCGVSILSEALVDGDIESDVIGITERITEFDPLSQSELKSYNRFTPSEKLKLALAMAEPLSELHKYPGGIIVHDDLDLGQYLWTDKTKSFIKLNDFNRAEFMLYDEEHQEYCRYKNGHAGGDWRSPEEFKDDPLNEKLDVFSLGNNFYSLLTGLKTYYNVSDDHGWDRIQHNVKHGIFPEIDPRYRKNSYAEGKLVEAIERCHVLDPDDRADIDEIIELLKTAIAENERHQH